MSYQEALGAIAAKGGADPLMAALLAENLRLRNLVSKLGGVDRKSDEK